MKISLQQTALSVLTLSLSIAIVVYISGNAAQFGNQILLVRAGTLALAILAGLTSLYPFNPLFSSKPIAYFLSICVPAIIPAFIYFLLILPTQVGEGFTARQLSSALITDGSSNGLVEVGFSYPIYTPTISIRNNSLFTEQVNVFLRMTNSNGEDSLFRAIRNSVPGNSLSVESSVRGLLRDVEKVLFLPVAVPPVSEITGQLVFVISNLENGARFSDALRQASQSQFELRSPETGELLLEFPLDQL